MRNAVAVGLLSLTLGGCASLGTLGGSPVGQSCSEHLGQTVELQLNLAREMLDQGRAHAALANLETLPQDSLDVRESKALALRRIGSPLARTEYQSLLSTCKAAEAHHGLGLIAMRSGNRIEAERELREAARLQPTDSSFRNDLGVVLLDRGDRSGARFEFITALELSEGGKLPATNLLSLMYLEGENSQAEGLIQRTGLSTDDVREAHERADALRSPNSSPAPAESLSHQQPAPATEQVDAVVQVQAPVVSVDAVAQDHTSAAARDAGLLVKAR
ncbi:tetratricopeptide repeat protein [Pseudomonas sp. NY15181]|uniref:tetratricopeptide repeat protein n=1 Tax=Pseudomonas sp. NY15181 TaxID=3400349 RepID=UPI003A89A76E